MKTIIMTLMTLFTFAAQAQESSLQTQYAQQMLTAAEQNARTYMNQLNNSQIRPDEYITRFEIVNVLPLSFVALWSNGSICLMQQKELMDSPGGVKTEVNLLETCPGRAKNQWYSRLEGQLIFIKNTLK